MGTNPSKFQEGWSAGLRPVEQISLDDVEAFLHRLNERHAGERRLGLVGEWRLPSEVEWEYAARAGTQGRWSFGEKDIELDEHGWHAGNAGGSTREVGLKKANPWGFYDMNGLVNEWCSDHWARNYEGGRTQKPHLLEIRHGMSFGVAPGLQRVNQRGAVLAFSQNGINKATGLAFALFGRRSTISRMEIKGHLHPSVKQS